MEFRKIAAQHIRAPQVVDSLFTAACVKMFLRLLKRVSTYLIEIEFRCKGKLAQSERNLKSILALAFNSPTISPMQCLQQQSLLVSLKSLRDCLFNYLKYGCTQRFILRRFHFLKSLNATNSGAKLHNNLSFAAVTKQIRWRCSLHKVASFFFSAFAVAWHHLQWKRRSGIQFKFSRIRFFHQKWSEQIWSKRIYVFHLASLSVVMIGLTGRLPFNSAVPQVEADACCPTTSLWVIPNVSALRQRERRESNIEKRLIEL